MTEQARRILALCESLTHGERRAVAAALLDREDTMTAGEKLAVAWCRENGTTLSEMRRRSRAPLLLDKRRQLYAALAVAGLSSTEIGRVCDRDHTSILCGLRKA